MTGCEPGVRAWPDLEERTWHHPSSESSSAFILILLRNGVVAGVLLKRSKGEDAGWFAITSGWAFAVFAGVFTAIACGSSDAHLNPAVTLGAAVASGDFSKFLPYAAVQLLGAFLGAVAVWIHYLPHWALTTTRIRSWGRFARYRLSATSVPT